MNPDKEMVKTKRRYLLTHPIPLLFGERVLDYNDYGCSKKLQITLYNGDLYFDDKENPLRNAQYQMIPHKEAIRLLHTLITMYESDAWGRVNLKMDIARNIHSRFHYPVFVGKYYVRIGCYGFDWDFLKVLYFKLLKYDSDRSSKSNS